MKTRASAPNLSRMKTAPWHAVLLLPLFSCAASAPRNENPACAGFDLAQSDARAIAIADLTMDALGGRAAWDNTRCIQWTFAHKRTLLWDKSTGDLRLDDGSRTVLMNVRSGQGRVFEGGAELVRDADKKRDALDRAYKVFVNDSYWMFAPYKLKDSGVTLKYAGERALSDGRAADVLRLQFTGVGVTPDNAYEMWVARDTKLVEQWAYFRRNDDQEPSMTTPWSGWTRYGSILLASDHGSGPSTTDIAVFDAPPPRMTDALLK